VYGAVADGADHGGVAVVEEQGGAGVHGGDAGHLAVGEGEVEDVEWWAAHQVKFHTTATKTLHHSAAGELELTGEALTLPADHGLTIIAYTVEPHSASEQALNFLASWSAQAPPASPRESKTIEETK
jgi:hypothetical protein